MKRYWMSLSLALISTLAVAAPHVPTADETLAIGYPTVEAARAGLSQRASMRVYHENGWLWTEMPGTAVEWLFVPKSHPAYPAMIKMVGQVAGTQQAGVSVFCGASAAACAAFIAEEQADAKKRGKLFQAQIAN